MTHRLTFTVKPHLPERLAPLAELAHDFWITWHFDAIRLFMRFGADAWQQAQQSPLRLLSEMPQERLQELEQDKAFLAHMDRVIAEYHDYLQADPWYSGPRDAVVAYFSMEFGLDATLPIYSGGLGVLAGDHLKSCSDLGLPVVGVGLLYRTGYFRQRVTMDGHQLESYPANDFNRPLDRRNMATLVEAFSGFACARLDLDDVLSRSAAEGVTYLSVWLSAARHDGLPSPVAEIVNLNAGLADGDLKVATTIEQVLAHFESDAPDEELKDDLSAWRRLSGEIRTAIGPASLDRFLQDLELRSKEPVPAPGAVSLATIHGAKGLEFDTVYLIGLAEGVLPSWHSVRKGNGSAALEEERRGCFVAITRTKQRLILTRALRYKGWPKQPSRFLAEMGIVSGGSDGVLKRQTPWTR